MSNRGYGGAAEPPLQPYFEGLRDGFANTTWPRDVNWAYEAGRHAAAHFTRAGWRPDLPPATADDSQLAGCWVTLRDRIPR